MRFPRSQIDFPLGPGQALEEIHVKLEEVASDDPGTPTRLLSDDEEKKQGLDSGSAETAGMEGVMEAAERRD